MKQVSKSKSKKLNIIKYFSLIAYIVMSVVLIAESCVNGEASANKSDLLGGFIANIFNDITGDQTKVIEPQSISIKNINKHYAVGDKFTIESSIEPENSTYKALNYYSSNETVASITNSGQVTCLKEGSSSITVESKDFPSIKNTFTFNVHTVNTSSITANIKNALVDEDNIYTLFLNESYSIDTTITPSNATNKSLSYLTDSSDISISKEGIITANKLTNLGKIKVFQNEIYSELYYRIILRNHVSISHINHEPISLFLGERFFVTPTFYPSNSTIKDYRVTSLSSLINVDQNNFITANNVGEAYITITPLNNPSCKIDVPVEIKPKPTLTSFNISSIPSLAVNSTYEINVNSIYPKYASTEGIVFRSSDNNIASITGPVVKALSQGQCNIIASYDDFETVVPLKVYNSTSSILDFNYSANLTNFKTGASYIPSSIFSVSSWSPTEPNDKEFEYYLEDTSFGEIKNNIMSFTKVGMTNIIMKHSESGIYKKINITVSPDVKFINESGEKINSLSTTVGSSTSVNLENSADEITYIALSKNGTILNIESNALNIITPYEGSEDITIEAYYDGFLLDTYTLKIISSHIYISTFDISLINAKNGDILELTTLNRIERLSTYNVITEEENISTIKQYRYTSSNPSVASINSKGLLKTLKAGTTTISVQETYSKQIKEFNIEVFNTISFLEEKYTLSGEKVSKVNDSSYTLINGNSASLKVNFSSNTTFTTVKYNSSNTNVVTIRDNGIITPHNVGTSVITMTINDEYSSPIILTISIELLRQDYIKDLPAFYQKVRKAVGHFGAFLVLGIFSSLTYYLFIDKKKRKLSIIINVSQGLLLATVTELIQLITPGRTGTLFDSSIDMLGFIISAAILTILFIHKEKDPSNEESQ